jgi:hypothetical protein
MRLWPDVFLVATAGILALHAQSPLFAQTSGIAAPFIGCVSFGQIERREAPKGTSRSVPISSKDADSLAYYASADGIGVFGPRGWYCEGASGSSGDVLFLSPKPVSHDMSGWQGLEGSAIEINHLFGGTSGRYEIAQIVARVFPAYRAFAIRAVEGFDLPMPFGPYPKDTIKHKGNTVVEYKTPAQTEGLGNFNSWLGRNDTPIIGAVILVGKPPGADMIRLSIRLPPDLARLTPAIVRYAEREFDLAARK